MTNEELLEAFKSDRRTPVDVNFGQIPLSPTIGRAGNYQVVQRGVIKENAASELSSALAQLPQIAGQFKNIQQAAGVKDVQKLDNEEIIRRVENGDTGATGLGFLKDWGKQRGYSRALYDQYYKIKTIPKLEAFESKLASMTPEELSNVLTDGGNLSAMNDDQLQAALEQKFRDITKPQEGMQLDDHMKVLHNESLRRIPVFAAKALGAIRKKQGEYIDRQTLEQLSDSVSTFQSETYKPINSELGRSSDSDGSSGTLLPDQAATAPDVIPSVRGKLTVYSPQKTFNKMEGGYPSSKAGPDGKFLVRTVADVVNGSSEYVTLAGSPQFYGRSYIIPSLPYTNPETGEVEQLENVRGVVHDTGSAFKTAPEGRFDIPLGKDLDNKAMNNYNALLNKSNVTFVRAMNQDGDPEDYRDKNEKASAPLNVEQKVAQSKEHYEIHLNHDAMRLGSNLQNALANAGAQGSTFTSSQLETKAAQTLQNNLMAMIQQGGRELDVVSTFLDLTENGGIDLGDKPLFQTPSGKQLYANVKRALITKQNQIDNDEDDEDSVGETLAADLRKQLSATYKEGVTPATLRQAKIDAGKLVEEARSLFDNGEIDQGQLRTIEERARILKEESDGGVDPAVMFDTTFYPKALTANSIDTTTYKSNDALVTSLNKQIDDPLNPFKEVVGQGAQVRELLDPIFSRLAKEAYVETDFLFKNYLRNLYKDADLDPNRALPSDVKTRQELKDKYNEIYDEQAMGAYQRAETEINQRIKTAPVSTVTDADAEENLGLTPKQVKAKQRRETATTTVLEDSGKLRMDDGIFEFETTYIKKAVETVKDEQAVETLKENNTPAQVAKFYQGIQDRKFKKLDLTGIEQADGRRKVMGDVYEFTRLFGMPMDVIRNGFSKEGKYGMLTDGFLVDMPLNVYLNSNNRLSTLDYATNGVYNLNASLQAANGNTGALREIYGRVFNTDDKKKVVAFDKFVELQIELGRKQGRIKSAQ